jgi:tetratricopeptide (TPR) repeat protein
LSAAHMAPDDAAQCEKAGETIAMKSSETPETMLREARLIDRQGRIAEAFAAYERILKRWPDLPDCWYNLAMLQRKTGQFSAALTSYQNALDRGVTKPEEVHLNRGVIYSDYLRQDAAAERELLTALALNPAYVPALINLANLHEDLGRREPALAAYERILELDPRCFEALARYAHLKIFSGPDDPLIGRLRRAVVDPDASAADRASLGFALGRALDSCGAYTAAFDAYATANRHSGESARPGVTRYDRSVEERYIDRLIAAFPGKGASVTRTAQPYPIFVCGMFRSGSTLIEQLLAGHPRVSAGGELDLVPHIAQQALAPFPESMGSVAPQRLEALAAGYLTSLAQLFPGAEYATDKRPDNFLYIGLIKRLFPSAKIVHTTRDPLDNCLSILFLHLDHRMSYALDLMNIGHHYRQYLRLMAHWKRLFGADILDVNYDLFVHDPAPVAARLLDFLGLEWDDRCLALPQAGRAIKTASVWQVREPLHRRSSGRARHYARELSALRSYLDEAL